MISRLHRLPFALVLLVACGGTADDALTARGTVEVREVDVAPIAAGRLVALRVDEGATVQVGDTLAVLSTPTLGADAETATARVQSARATLRDLEAGTDPQEIARAAADLAAKQADATRLAHDRDRLKALADAGAIAPREAEAAATAADVAAAAVASARELLSLRKAGTRSNRIAAARADVAQAEGVLAARLAANADFVLLAPIAGVVMNRLAEPGDLVPVGGAVLRIGAMQSPWVRIFVPASVLTSLALGDSAVIYPPGVGGVVARKARQDDEPPAPDNPHRPGYGQIVAINPRAEYVTRTALTEDERADLLFGVKVEIGDQAGRFKPGMPVTVTLWPRRPSP
jgi:HlyD family secretion protein